MKMAVPRVVVNGCMALALLTVTASNVASAEASAPASAVSQDGAIPVARLISTIAEKTGKQFVIDPEAQVEVVLIGQDPSNLDYAGFLEVLQSHGLTAVEHGRHVRVVPEASARWLPLPLVTGKEVHPDAEYVSKIIPVRNMPAAMLVPVLRPLIPKQSHFVAVVCSNVLLIVDTFGNVRRIEKLVQSLDTGEPYTPEKCAARQSVPSREGHN